MKETGATTCIFQISTLEMVHVAIGKTALLGVASSLYIYHRHTLWPPSSAWTVKAEAEPIQAKTKLPRVYFIIRQYSYTAQ